MIGITRVVLFLLCLNLACYIVANTCPSLIPGGAENTGWSQRMTEIEEKIERVPQADPGNMITLVTGYIWFGFVFIFDVISWSVAGLPLFLNQIGAPMVISVPLGVLWVFIFAIFVSEFLSGRDTS